MSSNTLGIIFSNIHDNFVPELTYGRTMGSIPFAGRYRLVDFALSNMSNSGITKVGIITKNNYQTLMGHIGSGKDWDLARKNGGVIFLSPFGERERSELYSNRLEALKGVSSFISAADEEYLVLTDCDTVCNLNFDAVIKEHVNNKADVTLVYANVKDSSLTGSMHVLLKTDKDKRVNDIVTDNPSGKGDVKLFINIYIFNKNILKNLISDATARRYTHFTTEAISSNLRTLRVFGYEYNGYIGSINSLKSYYDNSMKLLEKDSRDKLFGDRRIYTKVGDSVPTKYAASAYVRNSLIADGCVIEGEVFNSVIFRGVKIGRGSVVRDCVIMNDSIIGENVTMDCIISDRNVVVNDLRHLSGCKSHPFFIGKESIV